MRLYLSGFMGVGKTTVGLILAERLEIPFVDLDERIVAATGLSIAELFDQRGEASFRQLERQALLATGELPAAVVATGGGALVSPENLAWARAAGVTVWLNAPFTLLAKRLQGDASRPLFRDLQRAEQLYWQRTGSYRECDIEVRVEAGMDGAWVAQQVLHSIAADSNPSDPNTSGSRHEEETS